MNKSYKWISILILASLFLGACLPYRVVPTQTPSLLNTKAPTTEPSVTASSTPASTKTPTQTAVPTSTSLPLTWDYPTWTGDDVVAMGGEVELTLHVPNGFTCVDGDGKEVKDGHTVTVTVLVEEKYGTAYCTTTDSEGLPFEATMLDIAIGEVLTFETLQPASTCSLTDGTAQIQLAKVGNEWVVDPADLKVVAGYNNTLPGHDVSQLSGCDMWVEYESPMAQQHVITILRDDPTKPLAYLSEDGLFHIPSPMGGSFWVGPSDWNTADMTTAKPSLALEMASNKNANQLRNGYDWIEIFNLPDLSLVTYEVGHVYGGFYSGCRDLETSPAAVNVAGTIVADEYNASIGMEGCFVAVKRNGVWEFWRDAKDNVLYAGEIQAWLFKAGTTEAEVMDWIEGQE